MPQDALNAGQRAGDDRRGTRRPAELVGVPKVLAAGATLQVAETAGGDLAAPALHVDHGPEVGEVQSRAVGPPVRGAVRSRWRRARTHQDRPAIALTAAEGVAPGRREAGLR